MQRLREFGTSAKELDLLDERRLHPEEMRTVCARILGGDIDNYPHPQTEWGAFLHYVRERNARTTHTWNPIDQVNAPWININKLETIYKPKWWNKNNNAQKNQGGRQNNSSACVMC